MYRAFTSEVLTPGQKIGLYGGSFDPVHQAHEHVAATAMKRLNLDRVWWLVSPGNRLKSHAPAPIETRAQAIRTRLNQPRHVVSTLEARLHTHKTIDLVRHLTLRHPDVHFVWIMGADSLKNFHLWSNWREIADTLPICVVSRPGMAIKARLSPAARLWQTRRVDEDRATILPIRKATGWTYLTERLHPHASRDLRSQT